MPAYIKHRQGTESRDELALARPSQLVGSAVAEVQATTAAAPVGSSKSAVFADEIIDVDGAAAMLRIGRNKLYEMVARNEIPHRRFGRRIRFSRDAVMRWLDSWSRQGAKEGQ